MFVDLSLYKRCTKVHIHLYLQMGGMCRLHLLSDKNISILLLKDNVKIQTLYSYTRDSERVVAADWHLNGFEASNGSENNRDCNEGDFTAMSYCGG